MSRCATIALLGPSNAGKSTFCNRVLGTKLSIVTPKVQTTRHSIRAIHTENDTQLIFIDMPGVFEAKSSLEKWMMNHVQQGLDEADQILVMVDASRGISTHVETIIAMLKKRQTKAVLLLNKIDRISREALLPLTASLHESGVFEAIFMISALKGDGIEDALSFLQKNAPEGHFIFPEDDVSDAPMRFLAAEMTREKLFFELQQELPYQLTVVTDSWEEREKDIVIHQTIYVHKASHKTIILGKNGARIKEISRKARQDISRLAEKKAHLFLFVKVKEDWMEKEPSLLKPQ